MALRTRRDRPPAGRSAHAERDRHPHHTRHVPGAGARAPAGLYVAVRSRAASHADDRGGHVDAARTRHARPRPSLRFRGPDTARPPRRWLGALPAAPGCRRFRGGPRTGRLAHGRRRRSGPVAAATERLRPATPPPPGALPVLRRPWTWSLTNPASLSGGWSIRE